MSSRDFDHLGNLRLGQIVNLMYEDKGVRVLAFIARAQLAFRREATRTDVPLRLEQVLARAHGALDSDLEVLHRLQRGPHARHTTKIIDVDGWLVFVDF